MKLWSRGLGKTELNMDFRYYKVSASKTSQDVYIVGKINDPVDWEFKISMGPSDIAGLARIFFNWCVIKLVLMNFYRYVLYLFKRKHYEAQIEDDIDAKVNEAYASMMKGRQRPTLTRVSGDSLKQGTQVSSP